MSATPFSIVLVTFNSSAVIGAALSSIPSGHQVIVVDNASSDNSAEIADEYGVTVVRLDTNLGFGTACNRGADLARHERLLFLNPDADLEPEALDILGAAFDKYPHSAGFNPRLLNSDGTQFFRHRTMLMRRPYWRRPALPLKDRPVVMLSGAALAVRKQVFDEIGGFDEAIFLFYEDDDISVRILKAGYGLHYIHDSVVRHMQGKSSPATPEMSSFRTYHAMRAKRYAMKKHRRPFFRWFRVLALSYRAMRYPQTSPKGSRARAHLKALLE
ncbi:glycosyltransferase family 2 protein [Pseudohoeflea suaedae]|nr:glycosyltransferase family 2 protein [Pseudohoeflea suaedae]